MSWHKFKNNQEETTEVKRFLVAKGYKNVHVGHLRGDVRNWLLMWFSIPRPFGCTCNGVIEISVPEGQFLTEKMYSCSHCGEEWAKIYRLVNMELMEFTRRFGDFTFYIDWDANDTRIIND